MIINLINKIKEDESFAFYRNISSSVFSHGLSLLISFIGAILMARTLGAEGRGVVAWVVAFGALGSGLVQFGMSNANRRFAAEKPESTPDLLLLTILITFGLSLIAIPSFFLMGINGEIGQNNLLALFIGLLIIPTWGFSACIGELLIGVGRSKSYNFIVLVNKIITTLAILFLAITGLATPLSVVTAISGAYIVQAIFGFWFVRDYFVIKFSYFKWIKSHLRSYMWANYFANLCGLFPIAILPILLGSFSNLENGGWYMAVMTLINAIAVIPSMISMYLVPKFVAIKSLAEKKIFITHILKITLFITGIICIPAYILSDWLIPLLFGKDFTEASEVFRVMLIGHIANSIVSILQSIITTQNNSRLILIGPIAFAVTCLTVSFLTIAEYGAVGAALAWSIGLFASLSANVIIMRKIY
ncbi:oligosaccharide flippase family protein [Rickettsiales bacterium]|nr:oligosaccharide flippase family protein [Rickettsiales bacterium]